jgi:hypothetical protein
MMNNVLEVAKCGLELKSKDACHFNVIFYFLILN